MTIVPAYVHTYSGLLVDPLNLQVEDVRIEDVAHALANQCRFQGHTKAFYSVAQHAVICSKIVAPGFEWDALHHDDAEYVLQDMARPLKTHPTLGQAYRGAEKRAEKVLAQVFDTRFPIPPEVKVADNLALVTEARDLMHGVDNWSEMYHVIKPLQEPIIPWSPKKAEAAFLSRYESLSKTRLKTAA